MANGLPSEVFIVVCRSGAQVPGGTPSDCFYEQIQSSTLYPDQVGPTKEDYEALFGAIMMIVALIIAFGLMKKAIEQ